LDSIVRNIKNNGEKQRVSALAASAIGQALKKEKDKETQASFENDLLSLSGEFYPPELRKQFPDLPNPRR
jgi:hypothetical protein